MWKMAYFGLMIPELLVRMGLTSAQANTYLELVKAGSLTPPQLAKRIAESRTTAYMALSRLEEVGLAMKQAGAKKQTYEPASPSALEKFLAGRQRELAETERAYREAMPNLLSYYYTYRGKPGVRFFEGGDGLEKLYEDILRTREEVDVVRTTADQEYFGDGRDPETMLGRYLNQRSKLGIRSQLLAPALPGPMEWAKANDVRLKRKVTWHPPKAYTAPVEVNVYGKKVSFISFGDETVGTIIESPQIAEAMRELYALAQVGAETLMARDSGQGLAKQVRDLGSILVVGAHPDDEIFIAGGLMAQAVQNGQRVACVTATRGEGGVQDEQRWPRAKLPVIRTQELERSLEIEGVTEHTWLDYRDGECDNADFAKACEDLGQVVRAFRPDTIVTFGPDGYTGHPDHQAVSRWTSAVAGEARVLWAVVAQEQLEQLRAADEAGNIFFKTDQPPVAEGKDMALDLRLDDRLTGIKKRAFEAVESQFEKLMAAGPLETPGEGLARECFVKGEIRG
jgi:LmbE family N-acetylglucosaminyl deacetylase/predicted transcriptional regulator